MRAADPWSRSERVWRHCVLLLATDPSPVSPRTPGRAQLRHVPCSRGFGVLQELEHQLRPIPPISQGHGVRPRREPGGLRLRLRGQRHALGFRRNRGAVEPGTAGQDEHGEPPPPYAVSNRRPLSARSPFLARSSAALPSSVAASWLEIPQGLLLACPARVVTLRAGCLAHGRGSLEPVIETRPCGARPATPKLSFTPDARRNST